MTLPQGMAALERGQSQHDKQIKAIRDLKQEGMRIVVYLIVTGRLHMALPPEPEPPYKPPRHNELHMPW